MGLGANGQRSKNTRIAFGTINIGAHAKTHIDAQLLVKLFRKGDNFFRKRVNLFRKVGYSVRKANINK